MRKTLNFCVILFLLLFLTLPNLAATEEEEFMESVDDFSNEFLEELECENTTVEIETAEMLQYFNQIKNSSTNSSVVSKSQVMIDNINEMSQTYNSMPRVISLEDKANLLVFFGSILMWKSGCHLACELLIYYAINDSAGIVYNPIHWEEIENSIQVQANIQSSTHSGVGYISILDDLNGYLAIRNYSFYRSPTYCDAIVIEDVYDFDIEVSNNPFKYFIDLMSAAEDLGLFTPYGVEIVTSGTTYHDLEVQTYDNISHTLCCDNCSYSFLESHDCILIGGVYYCSDCPYSKRYVISGGDLNSIGKENEENEE